MSRDIHYCDCGEEIFGDMEECRECQQANVRTVADSGKKEASTASGAEVTQMALQAVSKDITPTAEEERLAHHLANVFSCRYRHRPVIWQGSLDVTWQQRQSWYFVARAALLTRNQRAPSDPKEPKSDKNKNLEETREDRANTVPIPMEVPGVTRIAAERQRQVAKEGWTPEHDDGHHTGALALAGMCYAKLAYLQASGIADDMAADAILDNEWPWRDASWKPSPDPIRNLEKAGALIAAEIDRLLRAEKQLHLSSSATSGASATGVLYNESSVAAQASVEGEEWTVSPGETCAVLNARGERVYLMWGLARPVAEAYCDAHNASLLRVAQAVGNAPLGEPRAESGPQDVNVPEMAVSEWQPIETAPVNQSVLVFIPNQEHYGHGVYRALRPHFGTLRPWQVTALHSGSDCHSGSQPTHWMPLPIAPSVPNAPDSSKKEGE